MKDHGVRTEIYTKFPKDVAGKLEYLKKKTGGAKAYFIRLMVENQIDYLIAFINKHFPQVSNGSTKAKTNRES